MNLNWIITPKSYGIGFILFFVVAVLIVVTIVVLGEYTKTRGRFLLTALLLDGYFFTSLAPAWSAERRPDSRVARLALLTAAAAVLVLLTGIWGTPNSDAFWKSAAIITTLGVVLSYAAAVDAEPGRLSRSFQVKVSALATAITCVGIAGGISWPPYWWVLTLVVLIWVASILVLAVAYLFRQVQRR